MHVFIENMFIFVAKDLALNFPAITFGDKSINLCDEIINFYDAPIFGGLIDNLSTHGISVLGRIAPKSWYQTGTNYPWTQSLDFSFPFISLLGHMAQCEPFTQVHHMSHAMCHSPRMPCDIHKIMSCVTRH